MLKTEMRNPHTMNLDKMSPLEICRVMNEENFNAVRAVEAQLEEVAKVIELVSDSFRRGGRLFYIGAGTSGRLGVLDASECPPTFGVSPDTVVGIIAGGERALTRASENKEDDPEAGVADLKQYHPTAADTVVGISAAGGASYVVEAVRFAANLGCHTAAITCNAESALSKVADVTIAPDTGAEVLTGSTRLKAGTAQKLILNMITTGAMAQTGKVCENMMINLRPTNEKLRLRVIRITADLCHLSEADATALLEQHNWVIRDAVDAYKK